MKTVSFILLSNKPFIEEYTTMKGTKRISDLITNPNHLLPGRINIIEANVSAGKTHFALTTLPEWAGSPERILYLIDTTNGDMYIQRNIITVGRMLYAFCDYNTKHVWGEKAAEGKMPVMTYAAFGSEVINNQGNFQWQDFDYIVCDEMQNLVNYQKIGEKSAYLIAAEYALRTVAMEGKAKIVGLSATPQKIREHFGILCHDVQFDRTDLHQLETFAAVPYSKKTIEEIIQDHIGKTGILYVTTIENMIMTKAAIRRELNNVKCELEWLAWCEKSCNPEWRFTSIPYSKRRARLVRTWWALKAMQ